MTQKCTNDDCDNLVYLDGRCILHLHTNLENKIDDSDFPRKFNDALIKHIANIIDEIDHRDIDINDVDDVDDVDDGYYNYMQYSLSNYLQYGTVFPDSKETKSNYSFYADILRARNYPSKLELNNKFIQLFETQTIQLKDIYFPSKLVFGIYSKYGITLQKIKNLYFNGCKFGITSIELPETNIFYEHCLFYKKWNITNYKILQNAYLYANNVLFDNCWFHDDVTLNQEERKPLDISLFSKCKFDETLSLKNSILNQPIFKNPQEELCCITNFKIDNCEIKGKFILNKLKTNCLSIENSKFTSKFELKMGGVEQIKFKNTNFDGLFDCHNTKFSQFDLTRCIFAKFVGFEKCHFGWFSAVNNENFKAIFKYVTFLNFTNFRGATFNQGLDLENTNLNQPPNFLNITINSDNTKRETYRIIKHSFDSIGNHIEGNKFFGKEMAAYERELRQDKKKFTQEKIIFIINKWVSNFGQSYLRPIYWFIGFTLIYSLIICLHDSNYLYEIYPPANGVISRISVFFNKISKNIIPFSNILRPGMEFISLIFYIIFSGLIWQTVVAIKRHTKR